MHILREAPKTSIKMFLEAVLEGEKETLITSQGIGIACKGRGTGMCSWTSLKEGETV